MYEMVVQSRRLVHCTQVGPPDVLCEVTDTLGYCSVCQILAGCSALSRDWDYAPARLAWMALGRKRSARRRPAAPRQRGGASVVTSSSPPCEGGSSRCGGFVGCQHWHAVVA